MKTKIRYTISLFVMLLVCSSCEDDFLSTTNPNAITTDSFWKTPEDFDMALNAVYSSMQFPAVYGGDIIYDMLRSDLSGTESWYGVQHTFVNQNWNDATPYVANRWSQLYIGIFRANQVLHYIETVDIFEEEEKELIIAQARFLRGLDYFWLINSYNQAIIHKTLPINDEDMHKAMSSRSEVLEEMIIPDFEYAYNHLPDSWKQKGRFTWGAAASMLGKTYLYEKDWTNAAKYFKEVIDKANNDGLYALASTCMENFTIEGEHNSESILEVSYSDNYKEGIPGSKVDDLGDVAGAEAIAISQAFACIHAGGYNTVLPTYWLQELFVSADSMDVSLAMNKDLTYSSRTYASLAVEFGDGDYYQAPLSGTKADGIKSNFNYGHSSKIKKYTGWYYLEAENSELEGRSGCNMRVIRLADVYLMYAEALLEGAGDTDEAIEYIDKVRARAGVITLKKYQDMNGGKIPVLDKSRFPNKLKTFEFTTVTKESVLNHIRMVERPLELCFEGHRMYDLVRWGIIKSTFETRKIEEDKIKEILCEEGEMTIPATQDKIYPLYLNERVRPDWAGPSSAYSSELHDYFPIPAIEKQSNGAL